MVQQCLVASRARLASCAVCLSLPQPCSPPTSPSSSHPPPAFLPAATRHHVDFLFQLLQREGLQAAMVHGSLDQAARKIAIAKFRAGKVRGAAW